MEKIKKVRLPVKKNINFAAISEKKLNLKFAIPAIVIIAVIAVVLSKFFVIDRFIEVAKAESEVAALQRQVDDGYDKIASFGDLADKYSHYTYSEMTPDELSLVGRARVIDLLDRVVVPQAMIDQWTVSANTLTIKVSAPTLQEVNKVAQDLLAEPIVTFTNVTTSQTDSKRVKDAEDYVYAQITVYLENAEEGETTE